MFFLNAGGKSLIDRMKKLIWKILYKCLFRIITNVIYANFFLELRKKKRTEKKESNEAKSRVKFKNEFLRFLYDWNYIKDRSVLKNLNIYRTIEIYIYKN